MEPSQKICFKHPTGEDIYLFQLKNDAGTEVLITNYGATITSFKVFQKNGSVNDIVLGFDNIEVYLSQAYLSNYPYFGAAIGRYGNRIKDARFTIDGKDYRISKNNGRNNLHGGIEGFDKKVWKLISYDDKKNILILRYHSNDGEEGFPGNVVVDIRFELTVSNELLFDYKASTDQPTAINLTHHSYFNLNNGKGDIRGHMLQIHSDFFLEQDEGLAVTGVLLPVANTNWDFRSYRRVDSKWNGSGYDQSFVVEKKQAELTLMAETYSIESGIKLQILSSDPIVHLYTGQGISNLKAKNGITYGPYSGFCLETQKHPNAINIHHFPDTILRPLETYIQKNIYRVIPF